MDPVTLGVFAGVAGAAWYMDERDNLKNGDIMIHNEADHERQAESGLIRGWFMKKIKHRLHPQHKLKFVDETTPFRCNACSRQSIGKRYSCSKCEFNLHKACALSDDILAGLMAQTTNLTTFAHEHPLTMVTGSGYTCQHCNNDSNTKYRYNCRVCDKNFHLMCAIHPTRLSSFLHPDHELELQTRHHFKKCTVCRHGGEINARVYSCEQCEFYVHPDCAVRGQYIQHPLHGDHSLVLSVVSSDERVVCMKCNKKCKYWCYQCPVCKGVYYHPECLYPDAGGRGTKVIIEGVMEGAQDAAMDMLVDQIFEFAQGMLTLAAGAVFGN